MKYCPYCGGELLNPQASFCTECGGPLSAEAPDAPTRAENSPRKKECPKKRTKKMKPFGRHIKQPAPADSGKEQEQAKEDNYDGYYDDVRPLDEGGGREEIDKDIIRKILLLVAGVLLIAGACVALMYLL